MPTDIAGDVVAFLGAAGLGLVEDQSLHPGAARDGVSIDESSVFVTARGGRPPDRSLNPATSTELRWPLVVVRVRHRAYVTGYALARGINEAMKGGAIAGYQDVQPQQSDPDYAGLDAEGRHTWAMGFALPYGQA